MSNNDTGGIFPKLGNARIDSSNSSTTPLGISGVFTGTGVDVSEYIGVNVQVFADEDAATLGVSVQTSTDGSTWTDHAHSYDYTSGNEGHFAFDLPSQYYRIVYTNGTTAQTAFRLQAKLTKVATQAHSHPIDFGLSVKHPAVVTKSVIAGETSAGGGGLVNVKVNPSGALTVEADVENASHDDLNANANIQVGDVDVGGGNPVPVSAASLPLPSGAATSAAQLPDGHNVTVDNASIAVTAASLPLPTGAATAANQLADGHEITYTIDGNDIREADDIDITLGNLTYTLLDQIGSDSYTYASGVAANGGKSALSYCRVETSIATQYPEFDIYIADATITTTSSDGVAWAASQANLLKILHVINVRAHHWPRNMGTLDSVAFIPPADLGQRLQAAAADSNFYIGLIWRGTDLAVGAGETMKIRLGFDYLTGA